MSIMMFSTIITIIVTIIIVIDEYQILNSITIYSRVYPLSTISIRDYLITTYQSHHQNDHLRDGRRRRRGKRKGRG